LSKLKFEKPGILSLIKHWTERGRPGVPARRGLKANGLRKIKRQKEKARR
jgi:hypothetical protein